MGYGRIGARVSPALAGGGPKVLGSMGVGNTNPTALGGAVLGVANKAGLGKGLAAPKPNPVLQQQQDIAMAQMMGLPGAKGAKPSSTGRQNQKVPTPKAEVRNASKVRVPKRKPSPTPASQQVQTASTTGRKRKSRARS